MSRIYEALKKTERRQRATPGNGAPGNGHAGPAPAPGEGRVAPDIVWDLSDEMRLEYERLQVWLTNGFPHGTPGQAVMVASCQQGNGATTTATGLAATLAQRSAAQVVLVDANLRTPSLDLVFSTGSRAGLCELLANGDGGEYVQATAQPNLFVLTAGRGARSAAEIFTPGDVGRLLTQLKSRYEYIVLDAPPLGQFPDGYALAPHVDAVVLVVEADRTLVEDARRVLRELERAGAHAAGVVLNRQRDYTPRLLRRVLAGPRGGEARRA
jgi:capsular exopolysaccharide synthesis family protein